MKASIFFLLCVLTTVAFATDDSWLITPPSNVLKARQENIAAESFFEVVASKELAAEYDLTKSPLNLLSQEEVGYYGQSHFRCKEGEKLYLVRAVYSNGGTGNFNLSKVGNDLVIFHSSLGKNSNTRRTALVVCLSFEPSKVFHVIDVTQ